jgi:anti-sigma B factor antagonist
VSTFDVARRTDQSGHEVIVVVGEVDLATARHITAIANPGSDSAQPHGGAAVRFDLSGVTFLDSTGLGALLQVRNVALADGREFLVVAQSPAVERVLSLAGLASLFDETDGGAA